MREQIISFETAKLAKEKGFNHVKANCFGDNMAYQLPEGELIYSHKGNVVAGYILAPTQSLLQKWLREEHHLSVKVDDFYTNEKVRFDYNVSALGSQEDNPVGIFQDYEEALEAGLYDALQQVKV